MRQPTLTRLGRSAVAAALSLGIIAIASGASGTEVHRHSHARPRAQSPSIMIRGTVVAENSSRHTLVVSLRSGELRTLRFSTTRRVKVGSQISSRTKKLADGTLGASTLTINASARSARLHATVISNHANRLELSGGGSVFAVSGSRISPKTSGTSSPQPGDIVDVSVDIQHGSLDETSVQVVGTSSMIGLDGVLASLSPTSLTINVDAGATTTVVIPTSITLPSTIAVGDRVELLVAYANQVFTLVTITDDQAAANDSSTGVTQSGGDQSANIEIEGLIAAADATSLTIQPGDSAASVTVAVPATLTLTPLSIGDQVHAVAIMVGGVLTLVSLKIQTPEGDQGQSMTTEAEGQVVSVSPTALVIQPSDGATPISFAVPATIDVSTIVVGDKVHARGTLVGGALTLTSFRVQGSDGSQIGDNTTEVDGVVTAVSPTNLTVTPEDQAAAVSITVPTTLDVSSITVGDQINATATIMNGTLTLQSFETQSPDQGQGAGTFTASGVVTAVSTTSLSIQAGDQSNQVTFVVPPTVNVSSISVGSQVEVSAQAVAGVLTLASVHALNSD